MTDLFENPMGLCGFEFVEFASPNQNVLEPLFEKMGFTLVAKHRSKDVVLYRQGDINFIINRETKSLAGYLQLSTGHVLAHWLLGFVILITLMRGLLS